MQEPVPGAPANDPIIFGPSGRVLLAVAEPRAFRLIAAHA